MHILSCKLVIKQIETLCNKCKYCVLIKLFISFTVISLKHILIEAYFYHFEILTTLLVV